MANRGWYGRQSINRRGANQRAVWRGGNFGFLGGRLLQLLHRAASAAPARSGLS